MGSSRSSKASGTSKEAIGLCSETWQERCSNHPIISFLHESSRIMRGYWKPQLEKDW